MRGSSAAGYIFNPVSAPSSSRVHVRVRGGNEHVLLARSNPEDRSDAINDGIFDHSSRFTRRAFLQTGSVLTWVTGICAMSNLVLPWGQPGMAAVENSAANVVKGLSQRVPGGEALPLPFYQAAKMIKVYGKQNGIVRQYTEAGGRLLYRGEKVLGPSLICTAPDLLDAATYHDPEAAAWFSTLDTAMRARGDPIFPSEGHLMTSDIRAASSWGTPCSIWPIGPVHYAWLEHQREWWVGDKAGATLDYRALRNDRQQLKQFLSGELSVDSGMPRAIARGHEVLMSCRLPKQGKGAETPLYGYIAIPYTFEAQLRRALDLPLDTAGRTRVDAAS